MLTRSPQHPVKEARHRRRCACRDGAHLRSLREQVMIGTNAESPRQLLRHARRLKFAREEARDRRRIYLRPTRQINRQPALRGDVSLHPFDVILKGG